MSVALIAQPGFAYPVCVWCKSPWQTSSNTSVRTHAFGVSTAWCNYNHDALWYFQRPDYASIHREIEWFDGRRFSVRWNCNCMIPECNGKNAIWENFDDEAEDQPERMWLFDTLDYDASIAEIRVIIERPPTEVRS